MAFSATDAAFEGFRVVRRKPSVLLFWTLFYMLVLGASVAVIGGGMANMMAMAEGLEGADSFEAMSAMMQANTALFALVLPLSLVGGAVLYAAVARSVLRPQESAFGYLRLGMDEVRVLVVTFVLGLIYAVCMMIPMGLMIFFAIEAYNGSGGAALGAVLAFLALVVLAVWLWVRFSLAVPIVMAERKFAFFDSFRATKGRFWPLFGMGVIAFLMSIVVSVLGSVIFLPLQLAVGGFERMADFAGQDIGAMLVAIWPALLAGVATQAIMAALQLAVLYAPFSAAYRDLFGDRPDQVFE